MSKENGFTLIEVLIAVLIFTIAAVGLFSSFTVQRTSIERSDRQLQAAYYGRQVLDDLQTKIDQSSWDSGALNEGTHTLPSAGPYSATYVVTNATTGGRKVDLTIRWNEP